MALQKPSVGDILWGNPLNDSLDELDNNKANGVDLAALMALVQSLQVSLNGLILPQSLVFLFEEGTNGDTLQPGNSVLSVDGIVIYSTAAPAHGTLGLRRAANTHGTWTTANVSVAQSSGSVYARVLEHGVDDATFLSFESTSGALGGSVNLRTGGLIQVVDPAGGLGEVTENEWTVNQWFRIDWQQTWDGVNQRLDLRFFLTDSEGTVPDDSISVSWTSPLPDVIRFLKPTDPAWGFDVDTYRTKNSITSWYQPFNPADPDSKIYTFDGGTDGGAVVVNVDDVVAVGGNPIFQAASALHGPLGIHIPPTTSGGTIVYPRIVPTTETGSIYFKIHTAGVSTSKLVVFESSTFNRMAAINVGSARKMAIQDSAGSNVLSGGTTIPLDQWCRVDWQTSFDTSSSVFTVEAHLFLTAESNGVPTNTIGPTDITVSNPVVYDQIGSTSSDWDIALDTFRTWGTNDSWPGPYGTAVADPLPPGMSAWPGDILQTEGYISVYNDGSLTSVGIDYSTHSDMTSSVPIADAAPNAYGWNRFHLTGLTPATQYYYRITDTVGVTRTQVSTTRKFRTLQPVGTPCSISVAIGSCKQNNPSNAAVFTDILTVPIGGGSNQVPEAVMRSINLGDFSYPNNLNTNIATHMYNWSLNVTDPSHDILLAAMAEEYIISDHDTNGGATKIGNATNLNDPVTKANIIAWKSVVPAIMEDTRNFFFDGATPYPGARYRAYVEGNVRFVKTDTRGLERSDTLTNPTDPQAGKPGHGSPTTMLGTTQFEWVKAQFDAAATARQFVVLLTDPAWNGLSPQEADGTIKATFTDKWPTYTYERDLLSDYAFGKIGANMIIFHGDTHGLQADDGLTPKFDGLGNRLNDKNGFAVFCCGPYCQNLHMHYTNAYGFNYPSGIGDGQTGGTDTGPYRTGMQWVYLNINESSAFHFDVKIMSRDATPHKSGGNPVYATGTPKTVNTFTRTYIT